MATETEWGVEAPIARTEAPLAPSRPFTQRRCGLIWSVLIVTTWGLIAWVLP